MEKERENQRLKQEVTGLKQALKEADGECVTYKHETLESSIRKGYALGFLEEDVYV